jgi:SNF2 family DNA or RNA helicase
MRRILTGTPGKPMEQYSQFTFLSPHILNSPSYLAFKHEYGVWVQITTDGGRSFEKLTGHKNLDRLRSLTAPFSFRVTRAEAFPHMPPKQYTKRFIELSPEQSRMYKELHHNYITSFADGHTVTASEVLVRYLRLQQIVCGYVPVDEGFMQVVEGEPMAQPEKLIPGANPRLDAMLDLVEETDGQILIWCRFKMDVRLIREALRGKVDCAEYHGGVKDKEKPDMLASFQSGERRILLGNARAAGRGLDMSAADVVVYYSNYFGLETRQQSEDRPQHPKRKKSVQYVDIVAERTIDERIIRALRSDQQLADLITGDPAKDWI